MELYGHRGARDEAPENTIMGFRHLLRLDIFKVELDVRLSKDGIPVVIHDETIDRTTRGSGVVANMTAEELGQYSIPTLEEVFIDADEMQHYQLEIKSDKPERIKRLCSVIEELINRMNFNKKIVITSLSTAVLQQFKTKAPTLNRGFVCDRGVLFPIKKALRYDCQFLCMHYKKCSSRLVKRAHKKGLHVSVWTVNDIYDARELRAMRVDSLITDQPTKIRDFFTIFCS